MIKNWNEFNEAVGGFEVPLKQIGPNFGEQKLPTTLNKTHTQLIEAQNGEIYSMDNFLDLYNLYLTSGGRENLSEFSKINIDKINQFLNR
jgi:hypothetical protein